MLSIIVNMIKKTNNEVLRIIYREELQYTCNIIYGWIKKISLNLSPPQR